MRGKKVLLVGLTIILALTVMSVGACGGDEGSSTTVVDPKVTMQQALDPVEAYMADLMGSVTSGQANGADLKAAVKTAAVQWKAVVDACAGIGADPAEAQQLWDALTAAINALPDDAGMAQMAALAGPGIAVQTFVTGLRTKVGSSAGGAATTTPAS